VFLPSLVPVVGWGAVALAGGVLIVREVWRRLARRYEYRWETFAVHGAGGRQLLHIRRSEIVSVDRLGLKERVTGAGRFRRLARTSLAPKVVIRSNIAQARPVVVSWEGRAIAGVTPPGLKLRPERFRREG